MSVFQLYVLYLTVHYFHCNWCCLFIRICLQDSSKSRRQMSMKFFWVDSLQDAEKLLTFESDLGFHGFLTALWFAVDACEVQGQR